MILTRPSINLLQSISHLKWSSWWQLLTASYCKLRLRRALKPFKQISALVALISYYCNVSLRKIIIHDINATPHWSFIKYPTSKMELFVTTINHLKLLTFVKKSLRTFKQICTLVALISCFIVICRWGR